MRLRIGLSLAILVLPLALAAPAALAQDEEDTVWDGSFATDYDLQMVAYSAYNGAQQYAVDHDNLFLLSGADYSRLVRAIKAGLDTENYGAATVATRPVSSVAAATACGVDGQTDLRVKVTPDGAGILIVAVSAERMSAYEYDPDKSADIIITYPQECGGPLAEPGDASQVSTTTTSERPAEEPADDDLDTGGKAK